MEKINRRRFLSQSGKGAVGAAALWNVSPARVLGANERVNLALIGCGGRGPLVAQGVTNFNARFTHVCDVHSGRAEAVAKLIGEKQGHTPKTSQDLRHVLSANDVDAVIIATPDHWHAPAAILACQAGKDVYVEKPHSHNIWESRKMIEAARKYNRVFQVGTQNRSAPYNFAARDYIKSGGPGDIHLVKVYNMKSGAPFKLGDAGKKPNELDWSAWLGPASERPYHQRLFAHGWQHYWDFNGGDMAGDGIHQIDLAMMIMGNPGMPKSVYCSGGRYHYRGDDSEVPDLQVATIEFDNFLMTIEHSNYPEYMRKTTTDIRRNALHPFWTQNSTRIELYGSKEMMIVGRHGGGWISMGNYAEVTQKVYGDFPDAVHQENFLECVRSRKRASADIELLHASGCVTHMANISLRIGGRKVRLDPKTERFIDDAEANKLIKRSYREGYSIPEQV